MPRGDRTGPMGAGPMTGRAAGYCAGYSVPGYANPVDAGVGYGYGRGMGMGRGWFGRGGGRGFGRGFGWRAAAYPYAYPSVPYTPGASIQPQQEAELLKGQAKAVQEELNAINQRIKELGSNNASETDE